MKIKTGKRYFPNRTYLTHIFAVIFHRELTSTPTTHYKKYSEKSNDNKEAENKSILTGTYLFWPIKKLCFCRAFEELNFKSFLWHKRLPDPMRKTDWLPA